MWKSGTHTAAYKDLPKSSWVSVFNSTDLPRREGRNVWTQSIFVHSHCVMLTPLKNYSRICDLTYSKFKELYIYWISQLTYQEAASEHDKLLLHMGVATIDK